MDIKKIAAKTAATYHTRNPYIIAEQKGIQIVQTPLKSILGYYTRYKRIQCIILKEDLPEEMQNFVCAHELGHAICHANLNTQWLKKNMLFSTDRIEREASTFAVELLLPDELLQEYADYSLYSVARLAGIPQGMEQLKRL